MTPPGIGDTAPNFVLKATYGEIDGTEVSLSEVLSKETAVLVFYRFDFGPI